jgi:hypothetical protein
MEMLDRESPPNLIAKYEPWGFDTYELKEQTFTSGLLFKLYDPVISETPTSPDPVPIQTRVSLSIEFNMDQIPIDNTGCYVKYSYPNDMRLPSDPLQGYISSEDPGKKMMLSSASWG